MSDEQNQPNSVKKFARLFETMMIVHNSSGIRADEIAERLNVDVRTIYRYIKDLRKLGIQIDAASGSGGGFKGRGRFQVKAITFSGLEAAALFMAARMLMQSEGMPFRNDLDYALRKVVKAVGEEEQSYFKLMEPKVSIMLDNLKNYLPWENIFAAISDALVGQYTVEAVYHSFSDQQAASRRINPYHIFFRDGIWYIIAYCHKRNEIRTFRLDRFVSAEITPEKFPFPADFALEKYLEHAWRLVRGDSCVVKIRFFPPVTRLIKEMEWHPTQQIEETEDGTILYTATVAGTWEIKKWILGWGKYATVIEPEDFKQEISEELHCMCELYNG